MHDHYGTEPFPKEMGLSFPSPLVRDCDPGRLRDICHFDADKSPCADCRPEPSPAAGVTCQTRQLLLAAGQTIFALGNAGIQLSFENRSRVSCTLSGYPTLQLLDARHQPIRAQVMQATGGYLYITHAPHRFVLHPGQKAYFVVTWANLGCATPTAFLRVTPPLNQASLLVAVQFCAFRNQVAVSPVESSQVLGVFIGGSSP